LDNFIEEIRAVNSSIRFLITVSPVPLVATANGDQHVLCASTYSKSVLRVVAQGAVEKHQHVTYFPAYEIVTGPQAPDTYFEADCRNVSEKAVAAVMTALLLHCDSGSSISNKSIAAEEKPLSQLIRMTRYNRRKTA
jgi:hypothetical protein